MSFWGRRSATSINSPFCAFVTSLAGIGGSPLLINIGGWEEELEPSFSGDLVVYNGARGDSNSSMWSRLLLLHRSIFA